MPYGTHKLFSFDENAISIDGSRHCTNLGSFEILARSITPFFIFQKVLFQSYHLQTLFLLLVLYMKNERINVISLAIHPVAESEGFLAGAR
ncbi:MAG: hypothetical protein WA919_08130 [Coleofasciculaceae cyanobacterium]